LTMLWRRMIMRETLLLRMSGKTLHADCIRDILG